MTPIVAIHVARRHLGLDEDAARDLYERETGKRSLREMSATDLQAVLRSLKSAGFKPPKSGLEGPFAKKIQALWIDAWNLGVVRDRRDSALIAFVKRQTGVDHTRFLINAADARKAIEALKGWMAREAGVEWSDEPGMPDWARAAGARVALAQWRVLYTDSQAPAEQLGEFVKLLTGVPAADTTSRGWIKVMNTLGRRVREGAA